VVHFDKLQFLSCRKLLLNQALSLTSMGRLDLIDLEQESFFAFSRLPCAHLFNLIC